MSIAQVLTELVRKVGDLEEKVERLSSMELVPFNVGCRVSNSANISVAHNTAVKLTFNEEDYDTDSMHSTSSNTSRITFNTAGKYLVWGSAQWATTSGGRRQLSIKLNDTSFVAANEFASVADASTNPLQQVMCTYEFSVGDYVELQAVQTSGGAINVVVGGEYSPKFGVTRLA